MSPLGIDPLQDKILNSDLVPLLSESNYSGQVIMAIRFHLLSKAPVYTEVYEYLRV